MNQSFFGKGDDAAINGSQLKTCGEVYQCPGSEGYRHSTSALKTRLLRTFCPSAQQAKVALASRSTRYTELVTFGKTATYSLVEQYSDQTLGKDPTGLKLILFVGDSSRDQLGSTTFGFGSIVQILDNPAEIVYCSDCSSGSASVIEPPQLGHDSPETEHRN